MIVTSIGITPYSKILNKKQANRPLATKQQINFGKSEGIIASFIVLATLCLLNFGKKMGEDAGYSECKKTLVPVLSSLSAGKINANNIDSVISEQKKADSLKKVVETIEKTADSLKKTAQKIKTGL